MGIKVTVSGVKAAQRDLRGYGTEVQGRFRVQVAKTAFAIEARAKANVRVDTGRLRSSITTALTGAGLSATVGSNVKYSFAQEFGIPGTRYSFTPYLFPAFEAERNGFMQNIRRILE